MILVFEAMAVAYAARCRFPVIFADALYWMFAGGPLVFATYGGILNMNVASVSLVAAKQGLNGVANISLATMLMLLLYIAFPGFAVRFGASGIRTWLANILVFMLMLPTVLFLWSSFDAMRSSLFKVAAAINAIEASRVEALLGVEVRKIAHIVRANTSRYVADALIQSSPHVLAVVVAVDGELTEFVVPHKDAVQRLPPSAIPVDLR